MANFTIADRADERFPGDFSIEPIQGYVQSAADRIYLDALERVTHSLAQDEAADSLRPANEKALVLARRKERSETIGTLRSQAEDFNTGALTANIAADNALVIKGKYVGARDHLAQLLFVTEEDVDPATGLVVGLIITVNRDLPQPNDTPSPDKEALFVSIKAALTVIAAACQRMKRRQQRRFRFWPASQPAPAPQVPVIGRPERLLDQYARKLVEIARLGLEGPHVQLANRALDGLKTEFVTQQAGHIKNTYIRGLGISAGTAAGAIICLYALIQTGYITAAFWHGHKAFLLAAFGACIGTWLSFSIRRVNLSFNDLGILEEDLLDPGVRIIFVVGLTMTVCLLFWTKAINISIGELKTETLVGSTAVLVGLFCGIAERALATAISGRATAFVRSVGAGS